MGRSPCTRGSERPDSADVGPPLPRRPLPAHRVQGLQPPLAGQIQLVAVDLQPRHQVVQDGPAGDAAGVTRRIGVLEEENLRPGQPWVLGDRPAQALDGNRDPEPEEEILVEPRKSAC
jgi:hypothetical protein